MHVPSGEQGQARGIDRPDIDVFAVRLGPCFTAQARCEALLVFYSLRGRGTAEGVEYVGGETSLTQ